MMPLCIYLLVSIFLYCLSVGLALMDDKDDLEQYIQRFKEETIDAIIGVILGVIITIPTLVYFIAKEFEKP